MRSMREPLYKWLNESEVGLKVFIFKSLAKSKLSYSFKGLLRVTLNFLKKLSY